MVFGEIRLSRRLRKGDRKACETLIDGHYREIYWYLLGLTRDDERAADLTQNTFAKAWSRIAGFRGESSFRTWLISIARNEFLMEVRASGRYAELLEYTDLEVISSPALSPEENLSARESEDLVRRLVSRLPGRYREVISLHYFAQMSLREIAKMLSLPGGTVKSRVHKALELLKEGVERTEVIHESPESRKDASVHDPRGGSR